MNNEDLTQYQTEGGQSTSQKMSMHATTPPAEVPGYRLERFLGSGAFGQVWTGRDLNTGRPIAVKFFLHRGGVNWSLLSHEVKSLVQLSADRHVVQVLEVGWESDPPYYVMELVTGGSLEEMLTLRGQIPTAEAVEMFHKICIGLNHSHNKGVLHCDLKPANILLGEDNEPRLADFGQSRMTHDQSPALGTLFYMAPEQADLESTPDSSWDVYAAGAILFRMLVGRPPYREDFVVEQLDTAGSLPKRLARYRKAIRESDSPMIHLQNMRLDRPLVQIISRCLAYNPEERYANVQEIIQDLEERDDNRARRPLMLLGIVGPLLLLIASSIFASRTINRAGDSTMTMLRKEALKSNRLAARFAARTLEGELERYFRMCESESRDPDFRKVLRAVVEDERASALCDEICAAGTPEKAYEMTNSRSKLFDLEVRKKLDAFLAERLKKYVNVPKGVRRPTLASMFVTGHMGTIIGIAYAEPVSREKNSTGRNFSYRTYFHALPNDLPKTHEIEEVTPLTHTHLSAAFSSDATGLWKVAVSTPIYFDEDDTSGEPDAVFVVTTNLGDFELLQGDTQSNLIAVLVEGRQGPLRGTVLQHPYIENQLAVGTDHQGYRFQVPEELMDDLTEEKGVDYIDPVTDGPHSEAYSGDWIATMQRVSLPAADDLATAGRPKESKASLMVLVQYRLAKVFEPVGKMQSLLLWEGIGTVLSIFVITGTLWYFVRRVHGSRTGAGEASTNTVSTGLTETIPTKS